MKRINIICTFWFFALYGSFVFTWISYGQLPSYSNPDPKDVIPFYKLVFVIMVLTAILTVIAVPLNIINIFMEIKKGGKIKIKVHLILFAIITFILVYTRIYNPFDILGWFFD